jgi:hypothetical protein
MTVTVVLSQLMCWCQFDSVIGFSLMCCRLARTSPLGMVTARGASTTRVAVKAIFGKNSACKGKDSCFGSTRNQQINKSEERRQINCKGRPRSPQRRC